MVIDAVLILDWGGSKMREREEGGGINEEKRQTETERSLIGYGVIYSLYHYGNNVSAA